MIKPITRQDAMDLAKINVLKAKNRARTITAEEVEDLIKLARRRGLKV